MTKSVPALRIMEIFSYGEEGGGQWIVIECEDQLGERLTLRIPHRLETDFFARFQAASLMAAQMRGSQPSRTIATAMQVERIAFGVTDVGKVGLQVHLAMGLVLDIVLSDDVVEHFKTALAELEAFQKAGGPGKVQ
jgi:hypothetical protein